MKSLKLILLFVGLSMLSTSCVKDHCKKQFKMFAPIYKTMDAILKDVKLTDAKAMEKPGKIFSYGNMLFINEIDKGIHVIDNTDPASPIKMGFINIDGNLDLWVKQNLLYVDCYDNLLVLDIADLHNIKVLETMLNVFPDRNYSGYTADVNKGYIIGWQERDTILNIDCNDGGEGLMMFKSRTDIMAVDVSTSSNSSIAPTTGVAGSLTRFNMTGNYLYCVDMANIHVFNISAQKPVKTSDIAVGWGLETIYSYNNNLFLGTNTGVLIYSLASPGNPTYVNKMQHVRTCDPVITDGQHAFVTLRGGSPCGGFTNQLDVLDVSDLQNVTLVKSYTLNNPWGLGMDNQYLFICDDGYGVRVYNRGDVTQLSEISKLAIDHPRDIIVLNNSLLILTDKEMLQFDYSDIQHIKQVSKIN